MNTKTLSITINDELISYKDDQINVVIPPYVRKICNNSISCHNAKSLFIPEYVSQIDERALASLTKLQTITVHPENKHYKVINNCLIEISSKKIVISAKGGTIPKDELVDNIASFAFKGRNDLIKIIVPDTIKSIGQNAFEDCKNLKEVELPKYLQTISEGMFYNCSKLTNIKFPTTLKEIGSNAFNKCANLKSVLLPKTTNRIDDGAFNCDKLGKICLPTSVKDVHTNAFNQSVKPVIYGRSKTYAQQYAIENNIKFVKISSYKKFESAA